MSFPEVVIILGDIGGLRGASTEKNSLAGDDRFSGFAACGPREICPHGERFFLFFAQGDLGFELIHHLVSVSRRVATELGQNLFVAQRCANRGSKGRTWHKYSGDERLNRSAEIVKVPHHRQRAGKRCVLSRWGKSLPAGTPGVLAVLRQLTVNHGLRIGVLGGCSRPVVTRENNHRAENSEAAHPREWS